MSSFSSQGAVTQLNIAYPPSYGHDLYDLLHDGGLLRYGLYEWVSASPTKSFRTAFDFAEKDQCSTGTLCRGLQVHQDLTSDEGSKFKRPKQVVQAAAAVVGVVVVFCNLW